MDDDRDAWNDWNSRGLIEPRSLNQLRLNDWNGAQRLNGLNDWNVLVLSYLVLELLNRRIFERALRL
jgi:hypothetical protein